ncbi:MAG: hypothetical protein HY017_12210 [Betaproteobacteria bacterium]|nr:hypothetical protein [Betaproteobacteria bacterium]
MTTPRSMLIAAFTAALFSAAAAQADPGTDAEGRQLPPVGERYAGFAGSLANLQSLKTGLRRGSEITLTDRTGSVTFTPPTRPMGYGNVAHALDLASRELARAGITRPTPQQIEAAMMGGTVSSPHGSIAFPGVLALRSQGMGWGRIAHTIGVHPSPHSHFVAIHAAPHPLGIHHSHDSHVTAIHAAPRPSGITTAVGSASTVHGPVFKH